MDASYHLWQPALRLFHPFIDLGDSGLYDDDDTESNALHDSALELAKLVEEYQIEPFTVRLDRWSVLPHWEVINANEKPIMQLDEEAIGMDWWSTGNRRVPAGN